MIRLELALLAQSNVLLTPNTETTICDPCGTHCLLGQYRMCAPPVRNSPSPKTSIERQKRKTLFLTNLGKWGPEEVFAL